MKKLKELKGGKLNGCKCFCLFAAKVFCMITKYEINKIFILVMLPMLCSCSAEKNLGLEQAKYTVFEKQGKFELRQYEAHVVAQTVVEGDFDKVGNEGFRRLFNYISGNNRSKQSIAMTAPVNQQKAEGKWLITFMMPPKYTIQTLPEPLDSNIELKEIPACKIAAVRYSGTWSKKRYEENKTQLEEFIKSKGLKMADEAIFARYDPPFQLFFLRRNEVLIPVE
jgi:effector-binding domain-containing protein